ncbi:MAG: hypothetical protein MI924_02790 [Chloroflexales bacterium]|nr:hypothetical protein [Chloroflexales bacterium]
MMFLNREILDEQRCRIMRYHANVRPDANTVKQVRRQEAQKPSALAMLQDNSVSAVENEVPSTLLSPHYQRYG